VYVFVSVFVELVVRMQKASMERRNVSSHSQDGYMSRSPTALRYLRIRTSTKSVINYGFQSVLVFMRRQRRRRGESEWLLKALSKDPSLGGNSGQLGKCVTGAQ